MAEFSIQKRQSSGRPPKSEIRQNIIEILYFMKQGTGYDIFKVYCRVFPDVTLRSIYYHLRKGVSLGEFKVAKIAHEKGDFSWGKDVEKIYYELCEHAKPRLDVRVKEFYDKLKKI